MVMMLQVLSVWFLNIMSWSDASYMLLLQCIVMEKAQEAYSALSMAENKVYA